MAFVEKITKLVHPGVLGRFEWPKEVPNFARYNLIYGWNGTGKTTISRMFRSLEHRNEVDDRTELTLQMGGRNYKDSAIPSKIAPIRVFNKDFVDRNVFSVEGKGIDPILILGDQSVEKQNQIDNLKSKLTSKEKSLEKVNENEAEATKSLETYCITQAGLIKKLLRSSDQHEYNNYNKSSFKSRMTKMLQEGNADKCRLTDDIRDEHLAKLHESPKPQIASFELTVPDIEALHREASEILGTTVMS